MSASPSDAPPLALGQAQAIVRTDAALRIIQAAVAYAQARQIAVNISVVDSAGLPAAFIRMPGAPLHSIDIAHDKAYTAASFGLATREWPDALRNHSAAVRDGLLRRPRFIAFGGGLPIVEQGLRLGGIGVSGGSEEEDEAIARAGLQAAWLDRPESGESTPHHLEETP
ncbi:hypothetical protein CDEN61S_03591 [Castellaniella denitrificans]|uniref:GlcG/HbpS family heme-binding protein n=1 Tax=Castellaniella sp. TaxID=1955812 RepID=UPI002AFE056D|nr:heme-binding protein [Castellaniella sp.]